MSTFKNLEALLNSLEADFNKFYQDNNKAAGTRVRKGMLDIKNMAQEIRLEVQNKKNAQ
jgi:hypothetical protein